MKKEKLVRATAKLVLFGKKVGVGFDHEIATAAGLALGDEVRVTFEDRSLVVRRLRKASSAEEIALGLLGPRGVSLSGVSVNVRKHYPHVTCFVVRQALDALVAAGRARVEKKEIRIGRKRLLTYHWYPVSEK